MAVVDSPQINRTEVHTNTLNEISRGINDMEGVNRVLKVAKDLGSTEGYGIVKSLESAIRPLPIANEALPLAINMRKEIVTDSLSFIENEIIRTDGETSVNYVNEQDQVKSPLRIQGFNQAGYRLEVLIQADEKGTKVVVRQLHSEETDNNFNVDRLTVDLFDKAIKAANAIDSDVQTFLIHNGLVCTDLNRYTQINGGSKGPVPFNPNILVGMVALPIPGSNGEKVTDTIVTDWKSYYERFGRQSGLEKRGRDNSISAVAKSR